MPNLPISQLPELTATTSNAEYVVAQGGVTYKIKQSNIHSNGLWGSFISGVVQSAALSTNAYAMSAETQTSGSGVTVVDNSKFTVLSAGTYNIQFSAQIEDTGNSSQKTIDIWLAIDETPVNNSNTQVQLNSNNGKLVVSWNFVEPLSAGQYVQIMWTASNSSVILNTLGAQINPTRPAVPSVIVTITQV
jgi:hypothetical protein